MRNTILTIALAVLCPFVSGQEHTVGLISYDNTKTFNGYNLLYPHEQPNVYLLNNCGEIVHTWTDENTSRPGNTAYLMPDGTLIKTKRSAQITGNPIWSGGGGGTVEKRDWNNNLLWTFTLNDSFNRLHHDIAPMPNGNVLMICWEKKMAAEAIAKGRNPANVANGEIWPDKIIEVKPIGKDSFSIVWEWHLWDHLIQNFDSTKPGFGNPADFPGRIDFNYATMSSAKNWAFLNAISYNKAVDQIVVSSPSFNEIWIIDHSTTIAEAKGNTGGFSKKGGDIMFRWGNPAAYKSGVTADQKLFFPHDIHWMNDVLGKPDYGRLMVFNNRAGADFSTVNIIEPTFDTYFWEYKKTGNTFLPQSFFWTYKRPDSTALYSSGLSSVQRLGNGNTLICSAQEGYTFEITPTEEIVWEYVTPLKAGIPIKQYDTTLKVADNNTFRTKRYAWDFPAFVGKDLSPKGFIELEPDSHFCSLDVGISGLSKQNGLVVFPSPAHSVLNVEMVSSDKQIQTIELYSIVGERIFEMKVLNQNSISLDVSGFKNGIYFLSINKREFFRKVQVNHQK